MAEDGDDLSDLSRSRVAARLRQRFQAVKDEIRARARAAGLLAEE